MSEQRKASGLDSPDVARDLREQDTHDAVAGGRERGLPSFVAVSLHRELTAYLDGLVMTGENIGDIRRSLFLPWDSAWNGIVRDDTARRESA